MEEMPPRRMGSISVVVVFSSRLSFFSGGPEPPSPAARLLPGPDMAAAGRSGAGSPEARQAGGGDASVTCRTQRAEMWKRPELLRPRASSAPTCWTPPRRPRAPHRQQNHPTAAILDSPGRHWPPQHRAQAPQAVYRMWRNLLHFLFLLVALCAAFRVPFGFFLNTASSSQ